MPLDGFSTSPSHHGVDSVCHEKRCSTDSEVYTPRERRRVDECPLDQPSTELADGGDGAQHPPTQLPSPTLTSSNREPLQSSLKRKAKSLDFPQPAKRARLHSEPPRQPSPIGIWLSKLPSASSEYESVERDDDLDAMSQPPSKRSRSQSSDSLGRRLSQSGDGSDTVVSRDKKYSVYKDANYRVVMATKGSIINSREGPVDEDIELCNRLLTHHQPIADNILFNDEHFDSSHAMLRGRSEARLTVDLNPYVMPSVENLAVLGRKEFENLIEGHNDAWIKSFPFYGSRPQPDRTYGFKWSNFSEQQRRQLNIEPTKKSFYTAREDIYFPFLTGEVKCGKQGLDLADNANAHSMTVAMRGIIDLFRRAGRLQDVHRRILGFSVSHDDNTARLYAHYPKVDKDEPTYVQWPVREVVIFSNNKSKEKKLSAQFILNVCELFALPLLDKLKSTIDMLPDTAAQSFGLTTPFDNISVQGVPDNVSGLELQDESLKKTSSRRGLDVELRNMIQILQRQLAEQQRQSKEQMAEQQRQSKEQLAEQQRQSKEQLAEQQRQSKEQLALLEKQLAEQATLLRQLIERR